jgi:hypothetical protein
MATACTQELNALVVENLHSKEDIKDVNANIRSLNSFVQILQDQCAHIKDIEYIKATLDQLMGHSLNPSSSEQPSY